MWLEKLKVRKVCPIVPAIPPVKMPMLPGEMHSAPEVKRAWILFPGLLHNSYLGAEQAGVWEMQIAMEIIATGAQHRASIQQWLIFSWPFYEVLKIPCWMCGAEILIRELTQPLRMSVPHNSGSSEVRYKLKFSISPETATHSSNKIWWEHSSGV